MSETLSHSSVARDAGPELIWAYAFDRDGYAKEVEGEPKFDSTREHEFVWTHVDLVHANTRRWFAHLEPMLGPAADSMTDADLHPHVDWSGPLMWGVVHDINREIDDAGEHSVDLRFVLGPRYLITARRHPIQSAHAVKRKIETGASYTNSTELFEALVGEIVDAISRVANRSSTAMEKIEDNVLSMKITDERAELLRIRREVARYARLATSLRAVVARLDQPHHAALPESCRSLTARLGQRVAALYADIQYLSDRARLLNDEVGAQVAAQTNKHLFTLTVLTTLLLPPSLVTGYFGMNTKNLPFGDSDYGTVFASVLVVAAAASVYLLMRRNRMLG